MVSLLLDLRNGDNAVHGGDQAAVKKTSVTDYILSFSEPGSTDKAIVGGKGCNLSLLTQAGFPVPPGFSVTTTAYRQFMDSSGLTSKVLTIVNSIDYNSADDVETKTANVREMMMQTPVPLEMVSEITSHYAKLGDSPYVAVRSSGTAEDLAEASFAGLHDTLLDIRGPEALIDAVRECWSSLWSARATSYRQRNSFDHSQVDLSVVVQRMVSSEASGVLFTGNPMTTATDEIVINSSWGLGEAVVSGIVNPDNLLLKNGDTLHVIERSLGSKEQTIRRDPSKHQGTLTEATLEAHRARFSLGDEQAIKLARLGLRVQEYYMGFPQDIEWGIEDNKFYLLQSRPITGVEFSWDAELEEWQMFPDLNGTTWTRSLADENWTGAISPLMYSIRGFSWAQGHECAAELWGNPKLQHKRYWKFHKATVYYNCDLERDIVKETIPPAFRGGLLANLPASWHEEVAEATFSWLGYLKIYARVEALRPQLYKGFDLQKNKWYKKFATEGKGMPRDQLNELSDRELKRYVNHQLDVEDEYTRDMWTWFFINARDMLTLLSLLLHHWYDSEDKTAFQAIMTGTPRASETMKANHMLWELSQMIHKSSVLTEKFQTSQDGAAFLESCKEAEDGKAFLTYYREFLDLYGQRGMPDRDIWFERRCEDPSIDYRSLQAMLKTPDAPDPQDKEHEMNKQREAFADKVIAKIQRSTLGLFKAELFKVVLDWCVEFVITRDDERNFLDHCTLSIRWGFMEIGQRLTEYGLFESTDDVWFLSKQELYHVWDTRIVTPLARAKITARRRDFHRMLKRETPLPLYLVGSAAADLDTSESAADGVHKGIGTAKGKVTATARVVRQLKDIGRVKEGDILVVNSTDPGWTPVFHIVSGIVLETGGILSHGSCLAREYGLPAVQLGRAMELIPDGASVTVNGDAGTVTVVEGGKM
ncbi:hypothetical protein AJ80_01528 [Polytolypa hystricis UAMH7299]|uniref:Pyruvate, water dikinase n=1 Tax=Polytolypa hystricis (strain UAMH7299) TaxID=1447883 RepID=A0A2B7YRW3_POLH7|nr:hypothetical protein AJ80_01528 [Polytolypa hystricis UAMH7299]